MRIVLHRNLRLPIRPQVRQLALLPHLAQPHGQLVRQRDRHRHQLRRLIARPPKHHSLVAGAAGVDAHGDVAGLFVDGGDHGAGVGVEAVKGVVVSDGGDDAADQGLEVDVGFGGDFAGDDDQAGRGEGFTSDPAHGIFGQAGVENRVRNLVGDLIGMALGYRFRGK